MHLVVALVKVVQLLELVVSVRVNADNLLHHLIRLLLGIWVRLVEREHLLFFGLKFTAKLRSFEDALAESLVAAKRLHALQAVGDKGAKVLLFVISQLGHLLFQVMIVPDNGVFLALEGVVAIVVFALELLGLQSESLRLFLDSVDVLGHSLDLARRPVVAEEQLRVELGLRLSFVHVLLETDFELVVELVDFLDQVHFHGLLLLHVLVSDLFLLGQEGLVHCFQLSLLLLIDSLNHFSELKGLSIM